MRKLITKRASDYTPNSRRRTHTPLLFRLSRSSTLARIFTRQILSFASEMFSPLYGSVDRILPLLDRLHFLIDFTPYFQSTCISISILSRKSSHWPWYWFLRRTNKPFSFYAFSIFPSNYKKKKTAYPSKWKHHYSKTRNHSRSPFSFDIKETENLPNPSFFKKVRSTWVANNQARGTFFAAKPPPYIARFI